MDADLISTHVRDLGHKSGMQLDDITVSILRIPISRGKNCGVAGNGKVMSSLWKEFENARKHGEEWKISPTPDIMKQAEQSWVYYICPVCSKEGKQCCL